MPRAKKSAATPRRRPPVTKAAGRPPATKSAPGDVQAAQDAEPGTPSPAQPGSEQVMRVLPAKDEPVRRGGWVLTGNGWEPEDRATAEALAEEEE